MSNSVQEKEIFSSLEEIGWKYGLTFSDTDIQDDIVPIFNGNIPNNEINPINLNIIGYYYYNVEKDYAQAKEYYLKAVELGNTTSMNNLGNYYYNVEKDYAQAKEYYLKAADVGSAIAMNNLGNYYEKVVKHYTQAKKYYLKAIKLDNTSKMTNLHIICRPIELYNMLIGLENKNDIINSKIKELLNVKEVNTYINKINFSAEYNIVRDCAICLEENKLNICFDCMHFVCKDCYVKMDKCPYCK